MIGCSDAAHGDDCGAHRQKEHHTQPRITLEIGVEDLRPLGGSISLNEVLLIGQLPARPALSLSGLERPPVVSKLNLRSLFTEKSH